MDLEADSIAINVLELPEGLLGYIDGTLDMSRRSISEKLLGPKLGKAARWEGDVHHKSPPGQRTPFGRHRNM